MVGTTLNPRRRHGNLPTRARRDEYDLHVASRGFEVVPFVVVVAAVIVIIIIRMDHEHPRGPMGDPDAHNSSLVGIFAWFEVIKT